MAVIGLALSGGGVKGIAHLGLLKVLEELGVKPRLANAEKVASQAKLCDVLIEPLLTPYNMVEMKYADDIFEIGYQAAMAQRDKILSLV